MMEIEPFVLPPLPPPTLLDVLHLAVFNGWSEVAPTALTLCTEARDMEELLASRFGLARRVCTVARGRWGAPERRTRLMWAASRGDVARVALLCEHGADVHVSDDRALQLAIEGGHACVARELVARGADVAEALSGADVRDLDAAEPPRLVHELASLSSVSASAALEAGIRFHDPALVEASLAAGVAEWRTREGGIEGALLFSHLEEAHLWVCACAPRALDTARALHAQPGLLLPRRLALWCAGTMAAASAAHVASGALPHFSSTAAAATAWVRELCVESLEECVELEAALWAAASAGLTDDARALLDRGAHPDAEDAVPQHLTPIAAAVARGATDIVRILAAHPLLHPPRALVAAASCGLVAKVLSLLRRGVDINSVAVVRGSWACTALAAACAAGHVAVVRELCTRGADVNAVDGRNKLPLEFAPSLEIALLLVTHGAVPTEGGVGRASRWGGITWSREDTAALDAAAAQAASSAAAAAERSAAVAAARAARRLNPPREVLMERADEGVDERRGPPYRGRSGRARRRAR